MMETCKLCNIPSKRKYCSFLCWLFDFFVSEEHKEGCVMRGEYGNYQRGDFCDKPIGGSAND